MDKTYTRIASKIEKVEDKRNADILKCKKIIAENEAVIQEASKSITAKTEVDEFLTASEQKAKAEALISACNTKIKMLESDSLLTESEYESDVKCIRSEQQSICQKSFKQIVKLMDEMFELYTEAFDKVNTYNDLIANLARVANKNTGPAGVVLYNDAVFNFMRNHIGRLAKNMETDNLYIDAHK